MRRLDHLDTVRMAALMEPGAETRIRVTDGEKTYTLRKSLAGFREALAWLRARCDGMKAWSEGEELSRACDASRHDFPTVERQAVTALAGDIARVLESRTRTQLTAPGAACADYREAIEDAGGVLQTQKTEIFVDHDGSESHSTWTRLRAEDGGSVFVCCTSKSASVTRWF